MQVYDMVYSPIKYRETEGIKVRRIGIDISAARMQQELYALGIDKSVDSLSQADKALLRYISIMKQTTNAQGDMAATLQTPANALRVLSAQLEIASRWIGAIFIPALTKALGWVIAFVKAVGEIARSVAEAFNFEMPEIVMPDNDLNGITGGLDDVADSANKAKKSLDNVIGGFDELHILNENSSSGSGTDIGNILGDIELPEYDMFERYVGNEINQRAEKIKKTLEEILPLVGAIASGLLALKIGNSIFDSIERLNNKLGDADTKAGMLKKSLGLIGIGAGLGIGLENITFIKSGKYDNASIESALKTALSGGVLGGSVALVTGGPVGWAILIGAAVMFRINDLVVNWEKFKTKWGKQLQAVKSLLTGDIKGFVKNLEDAMVAERSMDNLTTKLQRMITDLIFGDGTWDKDTSELANGLNTKIIEDITVNIQGIGENIKTSWLNAISSLKALSNMEFSELVDVTKRKLSELIQTKEMIGHWLGEIGNEIAYNLGHTLGEIVLWCQNTWGIFVSWGQNTLESIVNFFKSIPEKSAAELKNFKDTVITFKNNAITWFNEELPKIVSSVVEWFKKIPERIKTAFITIKSKILDIGKYLWDGIIEGLTNGLKYIKELADDFVDGFCDALGIHSPSTVMRDSVGIYMAQGIAEGLTLGTNSIVSAAQGIANAVQGVFNGITYDVNTNYMELIQQAKAIGDFAEAARLEEIRNAKILGEGMGYELTYEFTEALTPVSEGIESLGASQLEFNLAESERFIESLEAQSANVDYITSAFSSDMTDFGTKFTNFVVGQNNNFGNIISAIKDAKEQIVSATRAIKINITNNYISNSGVATGFADGGYPRKAQLFYARENGMPEMVGQVGNQTAVASNDQITTAIKQAVYEAMSAVMSQGGGGVQEINLNITTELDGETVYKNQQKVAASKGYDFKMGAFAR